MFAQSNNAAPVAACSSFTGDELMEIDIDKLKAEVKEVSVVTFTEFIAMLTTTWQCVVSQTIIAFTLLFWFR